MQTVWFRTSKNAWFATLLEGGRQKQIRLVNASNDKHGEQLAEDQLLKELAARDYSAAKEASAEPIPRRATVAHVVHAFLEHSRGEHAAETATWYRNLLTPFVEQFGRLRVTRLRKKHVRAWVRDKGYNPTSAGKAIGALKRAFNWAVEEERIPRNPVAHVRKPKQLTRDRTVTPEERALILSSIRGPAFRRFVSAMTLTGCRPGEVARVTAADVDLDAGLWVLRKHKSTAKTGKARVVYLPPKALELTRLLVRDHPEGVALPRLAGPAVDPQRRPHPVPAAPQEVPAAQGGVAYTYRSSFATDALEAGVPDASVAALLGHTRRPPCTGSTTACRRGPGTCRRRWRGLFAQQRVTPLPARPDERVEVGGVDQDAAPLPRHPMARSTRAGAPASSTSMTRTATRCGSRRASTYRRDLGATPNRVP